MLATMGLFLHTGALMSSAPAGPPGFFNALADGINADPLGVSGRAVLTALVLLLASVGGPRLAHRASHVPSYVGRARGRAGAPHGPRVVERQGGTAWLGQITLVSIWLAGLVGIAFIWFYGRGLGSISARQASDVATYIAVRLGSSLVVLAVTLVSGRILQRTLVASLGGRVNPNLETLSKRVIYVTTLLIGAVILLAIWGIGIVVPVALIGALTVALSLALQDILKNVVAGVYLLIERPFIIGDQISIAPYTGRVEDIQIRVTALRMPDGERVLVPNALLFTSPVVNLSVAQGRRVGLLVSLPDDGPDAIDRAEEHILAALESVPAAHEPQVTLNRSVGGKVDLRVSFWTPLSTGARDDETPLSQAMEQIRAQVHGAEVSTIEPVAAATN